MNPQILTPSPPTNFHFESTSSSAYTTAPSSPKTFLPNFFYSVPTSPTSITPYSADDYEEADTDFAFDFSGQLEQPSISDAEDLFHAGKIKPLQPPPDTDNKRYTWNPRLSPQNSSYGQTTDSNIYRDIKDCISPKHKKTQSLSPMKVSDILADHEKVSTNQSFLFNFMWYNKWNLKNLLLFRSTSEGSATTSDDLIKKYSVVTKCEQDEKNSSFRSCDGGGSVDGSSRRRRMKRKVSAHEIHYTANRAVAEEMKRRTFLPYKSGLLGCLGFSHHSVHDISRRR